MANWNKVAKTVLLGKKIVEVKYIGNKEAKDYMWGSRGVTFTLDDGTRVIAMSDDEGNNAGVLAYLNEGVDDVLPVLSVED